MKYVMLMVFLFAGIAQAQIDPSKIGCRDPGVAKQTKELRDALFPILSKEYGAMAVSVAECNVQWVAKVLKQPAPTVASLPVCGINVAFDDEDSLRQFALKYPTGRLVYLMNNGNAGGVQLCGSIANINNGGNAR